MWNYVVSHFSKAEGGEPSIVSKSPPSTTDDSMKTN